MLQLTEANILPEKVNLFHCLMSGGSTPIYVLGRNKHAQQVFDTVDVQACIDDFASETVYMGKPVIRMTDLPNECIVVSCVTDTLPITAFDKLQSLGVRNIIDYFTLTRLGPDVYTPVDYCEGNRKDIYDNIAKYEWVYDHLADDVSRQHFAKVVRFRLSMDVEHMRGLTFSIDRQYFEEFLPLRPGDVFVDGGGHDGLTSIMFANLNKAYKKIYYFEPVPAMMDVSRRNLSDLRDIQFIQKGLYSCNDRLRFNIDAGMQSHLSLDGSIEVDVASLDNEVNDPVTFVKLDIEGAEYEALQGAAEHIRSDTPLMAVCIYHDQRDFWRIPLRVLEINDRYSIYVRHYTESIRETVMFFVPKGD